MADQERRRSHADFGAQLDRIERKVDETHTTIHGNGNPGMKTELSNTVLRVGALEEKKSVGMATKITWVCLAITSLVSLAAAFIQ
jgi:hypothetical protein